MADGIVGVAIGLFFCVCASGHFGPLMVRGPVTGILLLKSATFAINAIAYVACGTLYIIASIMIRQRNVFWEKVLFLTCATHLCIVIIMLVSMMTLPFNAIDRYFGAAWILNSRSNFGAIFVLGHLLVLAIYTRWNCS
jgi:hypothetical protein